MDIPCPHCGQVNESQREVCWACFKLMSGKDKPAEKSEIPSDVLGPLREHLSLGSIFKIIRKKKTRIVVNGKEYERLEDVPEQFRSLLKDSDGDGIPDIAKQGKRTSKIVPFIKINFDPGEPLAMDPNTPVALPDGFRLDDNGMERRISWRWISWRAIGGLLFMGLWTGILAVVLCVFFSHGSLERVPPWVQIGLLTLVAGGTFFDYVVVAYLVNRTTVRVDSARVSVEHGPLPWFGTRDVPRADIAQVVCEKHTDPDPSDLKPSVTYTVKLLLKRGETLDLVADLDAPDQAMFIEQQIRKL